MLRQIKAMDYGLVNDDARRKFFSEKGSYSAQDESGRLIVNKDMDIALLMVYGHILYTGTSYAYALSKFMAPGMRNFIHTNEPRLFLQGLRLGPRKSYDKAQYRPWLCSSWLEAPVRKSAVPDNARNDLPS